jgi:hypothetical protein
MKLARIAALCLYLLATASCEQEAVQTLREIVPELPVVEEPVPPSLVALSVASLPETIYYARGQAFDPPGWL